MTRLPIPERFEILEQVTETAGELVLRARDRVLLREVLLKLPGPGLTALLEENQDHRRALREARALARLQHPGVLRLVDVIETPRGPLLVMDPVAGETLAERIRQSGPLDSEDVRTLGIGLASALTAVHDVGVVHRGLSMENVILKDDGSPCLAGFFLAKFGDASLQVSSLIYPQGGGGRRGRRGQWRRYLAPPPGASGA